MQATHLFLKSATQTLNAGFKRRFRLFNSTNWEQLRGGTASQVSVIRVSDENGRSPLWVNRVDLIPCPCFRSPSNSLRDGPATVGPFGCQDRTILTPPRCRARCFSCYPDIACIRAAILMVAKLE